MNFSHISDKTIFGRALRLPLQLIPSDTLLPILQGRLRGKTWIAGSSNHGCWLGSYEYSKQRIFSAAVRQGDCVFDLGANVGFYSLLASVLVGEGGKVFCFEPVLRNLEFLRRHLELNGIMNCSVWDVAVGRSEGTASFDAGRNQSMGRLTVEGQNAYRVRTVGLDQLVASDKLPPPNLIKCDIEGGEYDALVGASNVLAKHGPTIFLATHGDKIHQECCRFLADLDYRLTSLDGRPVHQTNEVLAVRN